MNNGCVRARGFTLVELLVALVLFEVGLLATAGMILRAQRITLRSHLVLRGVLEVRRVADSLAGEGNPESGSLPRPWGLITWGPAPSGPGGLQVRALSLEGDTLATLPAWTAAPDTVPWDPERADSTGTHEGDP